MTKKSITTIKNKLLSTSILIGLVTYSANIKAADHNYNNTTVGPIGTIMVSVWATSLWTKIKL